MTNYAHTQELLSKALGDKYEVIRWIGGGGMAQVFLAQHRGHGGLAAIKVLAESLANDPKIVERFKQEARTAASLTGHPNIVTIFDVGDMDGLHFLVMQYVEGEDLSTKLRREQRLGTAEALKVVQQVAEALDWAADKGVVHRDLKPSNIRIDKAGRALVLDFGIAKAADVGAGLTLAGETLGTPYYMSPEQIRGEKCDRRSDLYALGVILYELLVGDRPYTGENYFMIQQGHLLQPVPSVAATDPNIDPRLDSIIAKLMAKTADQRYANSRELIADLSVLMSPTTPTPGTLPSVTQPQRPPQTPAPPAPVTPTSPVTPQTPPVVAWEAPKPKPQPWLWIAGGGVAAAAVGAAVWFLLIAPGMAKKPDPTTTVATPTKPRDLAARIETETGPMVLVKAGEFTFGEEGNESPRPRQRRMLPDYYIDQHEVTNAQFARFCQATGHALPESPSWDKTYVTARPDHPVVGISYDDAAAFAKWANKRLPTEEEWEKAARGLEGRPYPWGFEPPAQQANWGKYKRKKGEFTVAAQALPEGASPYDVRHMAGNVWEWTSTPYLALDEMYAEMAKVLHVSNLTHEWFSIKGGSFVQDEEVMIKSFMRTGFPKDQRSDAIPIGFRCVMDPQP